MKRSDLQTHVAQTYGIPSAAFNRLYEEFAAFYDVTLEEFVRRRHLEMQKAGKRNREIYLALLREVRAMRFSVRDVSERQIRRLVYG
jgi:hypothetical protein